MIRSMSARDKNALIILITIILATLSYLYLYEPTWLDYQGNSTILEQKRSQLDAIKQYENDTNTLNKQIEENTAKIENLSLQLPNQPQTAELLYMLQSEAEKVNVVLVKLELKDAASVSILKPKKTEIIPYLVTVKGDFNQTKKYIEAIENLDRKVIINDVKIEDNATDNKTFAYLSITPFYLKETSTVVYNPNKLIP